MSEGIHAGTVALLREVTGHINDVLTPDPLAEHRGTPEAARLQLRRRELEDRAIRALHGLVKQEGEWGEVADVIAESEAWWVYMVLVERANETLPGQVGGDA